VGDAVEIPQIQGHPIDAGRTLVAIPMSVSTKSDLPGIVDVGGEAGKASHDPATAWQAVVAESARRVAAHLTRRVDTGRLALGGGWKRADVVDVAWRRGDASAHEKHR